MQGHRPAGLLVGLSVAGTVKLQYSIKPLDIYLDIYLVNITLNSKIGIIL